MVHIIGELKKAEEEKEALRIVMRLEKKAKERAELKREFRKTRNKVEQLKQALMVNK